MQVLMSCEYKLYRDQTDLRCIWGLHQALDTAIVIEPPHSKALLSNMDPFLTEPELGKTIYIRCLR